LRLRKFLDCTEHTYTTVQPVTSTCVYILLQESAQEGFGDPRQASRRGL